MILHGNQRGGARDLALHLLKDENEHVDVYELRGFVSDDLVSALNEAYAISRGTKAKQFLYSLSLNSPPGENVSTEDFLDAIEKVEKELALTGQPRGIIFHEKNARRHCHVVWSRIDTVEMKAIPLPYTKRKLADISRELYIKHDWQMPRGFMNSEERSLNNFTMAQWQQARRIGKDLRTIKIALQECWAVSDTQASFQQALKERGYTLAKGDRAGFVALDHRCEIFSISKKWINKTAKEVRARLSEPEKLPSVDEAINTITHELQGRLSLLQTQHETALQHRFSEIEDKRQALVKAQKDERKTLAQAQQSRWETETKMRQERFNTGLRGLVDHFTGKRRQVRRQNERETLQSYQRDREEKDVLIFQHLEQRRILQARIDRLKTFQQDRGQTLSHDLEQYKEVEQRKRDVVDFKRQMQSRKRRGPDLER